MEPPPLIRLSAHPTDVRSDCNLGNLKVEAMPVVPYCAIPNVCFFFAVQEGVIRRLLNLSLLLLCSACLGICMCMCVWSVT